MREDKTKVLKQQVTDSASDLSVSAESEVLVSIGTAARLAGVSTHVLRAWERRYDLKLSKRDERGRRVYAPSSIEYLKLINDGLSAGYKISELACLGRVELLDLLLEKQYEERQSSPFSTHSDMNKWLVYGLKLTNQLYRELGSQFIVQSSSIKDVLQKTSGSYQGYKGVLVEFPDIDDSSEIMIMRIKVLADNRYPVIVLTSGNTPIKTIERLTIASVYVLEDKDRNNIVSSLSHIHTTFQLKQSEINEHFDYITLSEKQLASLDSFAQTIYCECPKHISKIYRDVDDFINYVAGCEVLSPKDEFLHAHMLNALKVTRRNMVRLAMEVATIEGVELFKAND